MVQRSSTRVVSTALIGPNTVVREGLRRILHGTHYKTNHVAESLNGGHFGHPLDLISFTLYSGRSDLLAQVHRAKGNGGTTRIVVMADDACPDDVRSLLSAGVDGYLSSDCAPQAVLATLDAVMLGGTVMPRLAQSLRPSLPLPSNDDGTSLEAVQWAADSNGKKLSVRETKILLCLMKGQQNKEIARKLDIAEGTVKLHVKSVLRKLHVNNRTQAALWAHHNQSTLCAPGVGGTVDETGLRLATECVRLVKGEDLLAKRRSIADSMELRGANARSAHELLALLDDNLKIITSYRDRLRRSLGECSK